jgi:hypothetical protein
VASKQAIGKKLRYRRGYFAQLQLRSLLWGGVSGKLATLRFNSRNKALDSFMIGTVRLLPTVDLPWGSRRRSIQIRWLSVFGAYRAPDQELGLHFDRTMFSIGSSCECFISVRVELEF